MVRGISPGPRRPNGQARIGSSRPPPRRRANGSRAPDTLTADGANRCPDPGPASGRTSSSHIQATGPRARRSGDGRAGWTRSPVWWRNGAVGWTVRWCRRLVRPCPGQVGASGWVGLTRRTYRALLIEGPRRLSRKSLDRPVIVLLELFLCWACRSGPAGWTFTAGDAVAPPAPEVKLHDVPPFAISLFHQRTPQE
jgi:hypothetical protein